MADGDDAIEPTTDATNDDGNDDDDQSWVLDSLIGFLKSPLWSSSLNNFVDQMSVVFEPDDIEDASGSVQRRPEYENIFKQYRSLVDQLISSHMADLGISEQQFARACEMAEGLLASKLKNVLFEELWAAENFEVFARLMARRNVELQLEALDTLAQRFGLVYEVFVPVGTSAKHFLSEEHVMREAILRSLDDLELDTDDASSVQPRITGHAHQPLTPTTTEPTLSANTEVKSVLPSSSAVDTGDDSRANGLQQDKARLEEVRQRVDRKMHQALKSALSRTPPTPVEPHTNPPSSQSEPEPQVTPTASSPPPPPPTTTTTTTDTVDQVEETSMPPVVVEQHETEQEKAAREVTIKQRAEHLRAQRDRIIQMKQKERTEKISKYLTKEKEKLKNQPRPKTARRVTEGRGDSDGGGGGDEALKANSTETDSKELAYRKTLAARLKAEVVMDGQQ